MLMTLLCLKKKKQNKKNKQKNPLHYFPLQMLNLDLDFLFLTFVFLTRCYHVSYVMWMILEENTFTKASLNWQSSLLFLKSGNGVTIKLSEHFPISTKFSIYFNIGFFLKLHYFMPLWRKCTNENFFLMLKS